jgi:hypothetical protein
VLRRPIETTALIVQVDYIRVPVNRKQSTTSVNGLDRTRLWAASSASPFEVSA